MLQRTLHVLARFSVSPWRHLLVVPVLAMIGYFFTFPFSESEDLTVPELLLLGFGFCSAFVYVTWQGMHVSEKWRGR